MKTSKKAYLPPGSAPTEDSQLAHRSGTSVWDAVRAGQLKSAEALRRKAYLRLARTMGISWLGCRRSSFKH